MKCHVFKYNFNASVRVPIFCYYVQLQFTCIIYITRNLYEVKKALKKIGNMYFILHKIGVKCNNFFLTCCAISIEDILKISMYLFTYTFV